VVEAPLSIFLLLAVVQEELELVVDLVPMVAEELVVL
jgi:hypothetical protein